MFTDLRALIPKNSSLALTRIVAPLEKISEKIYRKPSKGGLPNILFVQAAVEGLPSELDRTARKVQVNFPWGYMLNGDKELAIQSYEKSVMLDANNKNGVQMLKKLREQ